MKQTLKNHGISKTWPTLPCAIFVAFFNVFFFASVESQAQNPPTGATYECNLNNVSYAGTHASLSYLFKNTSSFNFSSWNITKIVWEGVMSTQTPTPLQVPLGFSFQATEIDNIPNTNIKIYNVSMMSNVPLQFFLPGGPQAGWNTLSFKVFTPPNVQGDIAVRPMKSFFAGGSGFPVNQFLQGTYLGLVFPIAPPIPPPPPAQIFIDKTYISGGSIVFELSNLTPEVTIVNTIECSSDLSNPNGWQPVANFNATATEQIESVPLTAIPAGHLFFRIRTEDNS